MSRVSTARMTVKQVLQLGLKYYWIVDPKMRTIEAYRLVGGRYTVPVRGSGSDFVKLAPFPALQIPLGMLWRPK